MFRWYERGLIFLNGSSHSRSFCKDFGSASEQPVFLSKAAGDILGLGQEERVGEVELVGHGDHDVVDRPPVLVDHRLDRPIEVRRLDVELLRQLLLAARASPALSVRLELTADSDAPPVGDRYGATSALGSHGLPYRRV